jgi:hypothetical protein
MFGWTDELMADLSKDILLWRPNYPDCGRIYIKDFVALCIYDKNTCLDRGKNIFKIIFIQLAGKLTLP